MDLYRWLTGCWLAGCLDGWMNENGWMDGWMKMDGWIDECVGV